MKNIYIVALSIIFMIFLWVGAIYLFKIPPFILPSPIAVVKTLTMRPSFFLYHMSITYFEILTALSLSIMIGGALGFFIGLFPRWGMILWPNLLITQAIPVFALAPILVLWFGYGFAPKIICAVLITFLPITIAIAQGILNIPKPWLTYAFIVKAKPHLMYRKIIFPAIIPQIFTGIKIATTVAPIGVIVGEWIGASRGLAYVMLQSNARMQIDVMFAALLCLFITTLSLYSIVHLIIHFLKKRRYAYVSSHLI